jgi:hypothetical protein
LLLLSLEQATAILVAIATTRSAILFDPARADISFPPVYMNGPWNAARSASAPSFVILTG